MMACSKCSIWFKGLYIRWKYCHAVLNAQHNLFLWRKLENSGSATSWFLITEGAEAEECLKSALERRFFCILVSRLNKSFSVIDFYPSFHSSPTYNYPSVSKGRPCHRRLWQCSRSDATNRKWSMTSLLSVGVNSLIFGNQMLSVIHLKGVVEIFVNSFIYNIWGQCYDS